MIKSRSARHSPAAQIRAAGFALIETALALGVLSLAFVPLLAVIPAGLTTFAAAMGATVEAQIVQRVTTAARPTKFSELSKLDANPGQTNGNETPGFYFDDQGAEVVDTAAISQGRYIYTAVVLLEPESSLPAAQGGQATNPNLATLNLVIRRASAPTERRMTSIWIAHNGHRQSPRWKCRGWFLLSGNLRTSAPSNARSPFPAWASAPALMRNTPDLIPRPGLSDNLGFMKTLRPPQQRNAFESPATSEPFLPASKAAPVLMRNAPDLIPCSEFSGNLTSMKTLSSSRHSDANRTGAAGFSLVETAMALGILSFAFVALLGVIPVGLSNFATAINSTVEAQIVQRVTTVARQTKFSQLAKLDSNPGVVNGEESPDFYFNEQGTQVMDPEAISQSRYVYTAAVIVQQESSLPGKTGSQSINPNLATLNIVMKKISAPKERRMASAWIANNGS